MVMVKVDHIYFKKINLLIFYSKDFVKIVVYFLIIKEENKGDVVVILYIKDIVKVENFYIQKDKKDTFKKLNSISVDILFLDIYVSNNLDGDIRYIYSKVDFN